MPRPANALLAIALLSVALAAQSPGPASGMLVLSGAGEPVADPAVLRRFVELAGGSNAEIVYIPTAASGIRLPSGFIAELPESGEITPSVAALEAELTKQFGVKHVHVLHTRDRAVATSDRFADPLRSTRAVWIGYRNAGRIADLFLDTPIARELDNVLRRGGVVAATPQGQSSPAPSSCAGYPASPC